MGLPLHSQSKDLLCEPLRPMEVTRRFGDRGFRIFAYKEKTGVASSILSNSLGERQAHVTCFIHPLATVPLT